MTPPRLPLVLLPWRLAVCRLDPADPLPEWTGRSRHFLTITRTPTELSITAEESAMPNHLPAEREYRAFMVEGPLPHDLIGIFASMATPLAVAGLPIFAISTADTDYVLVKEEILARAVQVLEGAGHSVTIHQQAAEKLASSPLKHR